MSEKGRSNCRNHEEVGSCRRRRISTPGTLSLAKYTTLSVKVTACKENADVHKKKQGIYRSNHHSKGSRNSSCHTPPLLPPHSFLSLFISVPAFASHRNTLAVSLVHVSQQSHPSIPSHPIPSFRKKGEKEKTYEIIPPIASKIPTKLPSVKDFPDTIHPIATIEHVLKCPTTVLLTGPAS